MTARRFPPPWTVEKMEVLLRREEHALRLVLQLEQVPCLAAVTETRYSTGMLTPSQPAPRPPTPRRLRYTLGASVVVIGVTLLGAVILWVVTEWLWLVVHEGLR
jgi:hypothetical protein